MNVRAQVGHGAVIFDGAIRHQLLMAWKLIGLTPSWFVWLRFPFLIETWIILYHQCTLQGLYSHAFIMSNFKSRSGIGGLLRTSCDYPKHIIQMDCSHQPVWYWWFYAIIYIHISTNIYIYTSYEIYSFIHIYTHDFSCFSLSIHHIIVPCGYHVSICFYLPPPMGTHLVFADHEIAWPMIQKVGLVLIEIYAGMGFNGIQWDLKKWLNGNLPWFNGNL